MADDLKVFLDKKVKEYNQPAFIKNDPICIPHSFSKKQDIEIAGFFAAIFAWGNRATIISKARELMQLMDNAPYRFITSYQPGNNKRLLQFKHRTFNTTDLLYFIRFLKHHYTADTSLESAFFSHKAGNHTANIIEASLNSFYRYFFSLTDVPGRTTKHIASPEKKSTCKRLNMFLRWMVRNDNKGVDFGLWKKVSPAHLVCPVDVHVARVAKYFDILRDDKVNWLSALQVTDYLRTLDASDPVKYDFALFSLGVSGQIDHNGQ